MSNNRNKKKARLGFAPRRPKGKVPANLAKVTTPIDVLVAADPGVDSPAAQSCETAQSETLHSQLQGIFRAEERDWSREEAAETEIDLSSPVHPVAVVAPRRSNMSEDPFAAYKAAGRWVTMWFFAPGGLTEGEWQKQAGNLHYSSGLKLHEAKVPFYMRWQKRPSLAKMVFHVGYDPYPDLNVDLNRSSSRQAASACRGLAKQHLPSLFLLRVHTKGVKSRIRYWGESWPKCIKRLAVAHINRPRIAAWMREKINQWEYAGRSTSRTQVPRSAIRVYAEPLDA